MKTPTRIKAKRLAEKVYPDVQKDLFPSKEEYLKETLRRIELRAAFVRGYMAKKVNVNKYY